MLPEIIGPIPGPRSLEAAARLRAHESRNVTFLGDQFPVFWDRAEGVNVWDADGNRYLDLTSAFGVMNLGHGHPAIRAAIREQAERLIHGMGDVHPTILKADLCRELSRATFERWIGAPAKTILCNSGFEAVEAALKTAHLLTVRPKVLSFRNAYHGLGYGALAAGGMARFREPFLAQLTELSREVAFPAKAEDLADCLDSVDRALAFGDVGAVLVEPIQGRGGCVVPPSGFLVGLRELATRHGAALIFDEILTGFHRTGPRFACEREGVTPDLICLGKAMASGFPISACVGRADLMDAAWPASTGEALHTSTFLGHPIGCAMALASLRLHDDSSWEPFVEEQGRFFRDRLERVRSPLRGRVRGRGLMLGLEIADGERCVALMNLGLKRGILWLPEGPDGSVLALMPPFPITEEEISFSVDALASLLDEMEG